MNINLYSMGGGGINIGRFFEQFRGNKENTFGEINPIYIDTSDSNTKDLPKDKVYHIPEVDGSGKKRDSNYGAIVESIPDILHQHKPNDINILVHTGAGGSGSVLGPTLAGALIDRGQRVVVLMIGSRSSQIELENTIKTLKSYEVISHKRKTPIVMFYRENSNGGRSKVDADIRSVIPLISAICSGNNRELDSEDISNFLNYQRVTSFEPSLVSLDFYSNKINLLKDTHLVSVITLTDDDNSSDIKEHLCPYQATGFISDKTKSALNTDLPMHACTIAGMFHSVVKEMESTLDEYKQAQAVVRQKTIGNTSEADDFGMVL